uniref:Uncharacterized protein n=1 Tax=Cucumis melo TaxID=3656 RepID=A0A9I9EHK4_CUCME
MFLEFTEVLDNPVGGSSSVGDNLESNAGNSISAYRRGYSATLWGRDMQDSVG